MGELRLGNSNNSINLKELVIVYIKQWKWFALSVVSIMTLAFLHVRYSIPQYSAQSKIQIIDEKSTSSELSVFRDLDFISGGKNNVEDEIEIINSKSNLIKVVKNLGINVRVFAMGKIVDSEIYGKPFPFNINFYEPDSVINNSRLTFFVEQSNNTTFKYSEGDEDAPMRTLEYGKIISTSLGDMVLTPNIPGNSDNRNSKEQYRVEVSPVSDIAQLYQSKIKVSVAGEFSNILNISLVDPIQKKAIDIINTLVDEYNDNAVEDKKAIADKTSDFIDDRITAIYSNLASADQTEEEFRSNRGLADVASQANLNLNVSAASEKELQNASVQLSIASAMKDEVDNQQGYDLIAYNVGLTDPTIANTAQKYNELIQQRKRLLEDTGEKHPTILHLNEQLDALRQGIQSGLGNVTNNLDLTVNNLSKQLSQAQSRLYQSPKNQRVLTDIARKKNTIENLYLYLLQKREESQITFASAAPKSKVIDQAYATSPFPVSPKSKIVYLAGFILGLLIPFSIIYTNELLDNKIHNKLDLEKLVPNVPVLAEIPRLTRKQEKIVLKDDRSVLAESMRILRANLDYIIKPKKNGVKNNIIFVTSTTPGEGKSFIASNLAMIFANTNKKVLLIGADIRNPKLNTFLPGLENNKDQMTTANGLTNFLFSGRVLFNDIVSTLKTSAATIDVIVSGKIPPNPAELLMSDRVSELFEKASETYDYVIVDTAPLMVVTDTLLISKYADHVLYVTRAGFTESKVLDFPLKLKKEGKLKSLTFVVNNVKQSNLGYGGKYGYGYGKTVKKWWSFS
ncbi:polysaccharide biosynthesis tyrosine autokinase [Flagellimonas hymeniacidonis]|uniref:non-specific protein-tyrosine kinase n=1 Tax=Flagellimonas hymeniacidonis TaxID=2603628 RepID=A0A5C8V5A9_9FLAO|nr:tyrosine-protein kinase family protein [Flagellimonas hymeniacidonis]TXN35958.1 polysaccharide biosynthesis tyrosine autokinase [Flagellimonas hymeniacidonis]